MNCRNSADADKLEATADNNEELKTLDTDHKSEELGRQAEAFTDLSRLSMGKTTISTGIHEEAYKDLIMAATHWAVSMATLMIMIFNEALRALGSLWRASVPESFIQYGTSGIPMFGDGA